MKKYILAIFTAAMFLFALVYLNSNKGNAYHLVGVNQHPGYEVSQPAHAVVEASFHKLLHDTSPVFIILGLLIGVGGVAWVCSKEYIEEKPTGYWVKILLFWAIGLCLMLLPVEQKYGSAQYQTHINQKDFDPTTAKSGGYDSLFPETNETPLTGQ